MPATAEHLTLVMSIFILYFSCTMKCKLLFLALFVQVCGAEPSGVPLVILFSGSANGVLRSCHCPSNPWGGLAKRAWLMNQVRMLAGDANVLALDSGDLFSVESSPEQAACVLAAHNLMRYQAVAMGDQDFQVDWAWWAKVHEQAELWNEVSQASTFSWLSCGLNVVAHGQKDFVAPAPSWRVVERAGLRIGIISACAPDVWAGAAQPSLLRPTPPLQVIDRFYAAHSRRPDLVIALTHQSLDADRALIAARPDIDLLIGGHSQSLLLSPLMVKETPICQAGGNAENLGLLLLLPHTPPPHARRTQKGKAFASALISQPPRRHSFGPTEWTTSRWRMAQQIIPLTETIDEDPSVGERISRYYSEADEQSARRLAEAAPDVRGQPSPRITLALPLQPLSVTADDNRSISMQVSNKGTAPLVIRQVRSRSPWLTVKGYSESVAPNSRGQIDFCVSGRLADRYARAEFTNRSNDPMRPVVQGAIPARLKGDRPNFLNVTSLWQELCQTVTAPPPLLPTRVEPLLSDLVPQAPAKDAATASMTIDLFHAPDCEDCDEVRQTVLLPLIQRYDSRLSIREHDVTIPSNFERLLQLMGDTQASEVTSLTVLVEGHKPLVGVASIRSNLARLVDAHFSDGAASE